MKKQTYSEFAKRQQQELEDFPIAYAFNKEQLEQALEKLNAKKEECVTVFGHGDIMKKVDVPAFYAMLKRQKEEMYEALKDEEFAEEAFLYEMDNHEYAINWSGDEDVLACFSLTEKMLHEMNLTGAYSRARKKHMDHAREWDMI